MSCKKCDGLLVEESFYEEVEPVVYRLDGFRCVICGNRYFPPVPSPQQKYPDCDLFGFEQIAEAWGRSERQMKSIVNSYSNQFSYLRMTEVGPTTHQNSAAPHAQAYHTAITNQRKAATTLIVWINPSSGSNMAGGQP